MKGIKGIAGTPESVELAPPYPPFLKGLHLFIDVRLLCSSRFFCSRCLMVRIGTSSCSSNGMLLQLSTAFVCLFDLSDFGRAPTEGLPVGRSQFLWTVLTIDLKALSNVLIWHSVCSTGSLPTIFVQCLHNSSFSFKTPSTF
jgi:hypothetical protein